MFYHFYYICVKKLLTITATTTLSTKRLRTALFYYKNDSTSKLNSTIFKNILSSNSTITIAVSATSKMNNYTKQFREEIFVISLTNVVLISLLLIFFIITTIVLFKKYIFNSKLIRQII